MNCTRRTFALVIMAAIVLAAACQPIQRPTPSSLSGDMASAPSQSLGTVEPVATPTNETVVQADPAGAANLIEQGLKALEAEEYEQAVVLFSEAASADPRNADAHFYRGYALANVGRFDDAIVSFGEAIQFDPEHGDAHQYRGASHYFQGRYAAAVEDCASAFRISAPYLLPVQVCLNLMTMLASSDFDAPAAAIDQYDAAIRDDPDVGAMYLARGLAHRTLGEIDVAVSDIEHALVLDPFLGDILIPLWYLVYDEITEVGDAVAELETARSLVEPDSLLDHLIEGSLSDLRGRE